jgi:hypothetical protein
VDTLAFFIGTPICTGLPGELPYVAGCTIDDIEPEMILTTNIPGATFTTTTPNNGSLFVDPNQTNSWDYEERSYISVSPLISPSTSITSYPSINAQMHSNTTIPPLGPTALTRTPGPANRVEEITDIAVNEDSSGWKPCGALLLAILTLLATWAPGRR